MFDTTIFWYIRRWTLFLAWLGCFCYAQTTYAYNTQPLSEDAKKILVGARDKDISELWDLANRYSFKEMALALQLAELALKKAEAQHKTKEIFESQRMFAFIYEDNAQFDKALLAFQRAEPTANLLPDADKLTIYTDLAISHRKVGNYHKAYEYHNKTLELANRNHDEQMIESSLHGLGILHRDVGAYDEAIGYYLQSLKISEKRNSPMDIVVSHKDLSETYFRAKESEKALQHIEIAYKLAQTHHDTAAENVDFSAQLASVMNQYGEILTARKSYGEALEKHRAALKIYEQIGYKSYIAKTFASIANVFLKQKDFVSAEHNFQAALLNETAMLSYDFSNTYLKIGEMYQQQQQLDRAQDALLKALASAKKFGHKDLSQKINYILFLVQLDKGDNQQALSYLNIATALSDSLFNEEKIRRTAEMELKFNSEKRENEIHALKLQQNDLQLRENKILLSASIFLFTLLVLFLAYIIQLRGRNYQAQKLKNIEIQQQYRRMEESNEILRQFAYVAAHDLKEPLRSIGSYIGLIQMKYGKQLDANANEYMNFVNAGVKRMYSLLTDLLDFSQVLAQEPGCEVLRPEEVLEDVKANLRSAIETRNAAIDYDLNMPSVRMNRLHLTQLFQNLIGNALKFTNIAPHVSVSGREENGEIVLTIADNGIGIKPEHSQKIFDLFQQLNKKNQFEGTGIGLTICKNIVEKYNGRIWFDSAVGVGTQFHIAIPA